MYTETQTHATLIARLCKGTDPQAWHDFVVRYGDLIRGFCLRRGLQPADIEDVQQDVLVSLNKAMPGFTYDPAKGLFRSYLKTVVMHAISRRLRQNSPAIGLSAVAEASASGEAAPEDEASWEQEWRQYHFRQAMRTIDVEFSEKDRQAFSSYALAGHDAGEVAKELEMNVDAVYQAKSRIIKRLSKLIESQVAEEG